MYKNVQVFIVNVYDIPHTNVQGSNLLKLLRCQGNTNIFIWEICYSHEKKNQFSLLSSFNEWWVPQIILA